MSGEWERLHCVSLNITDHLIGHVLRDRVYFHILQRCSACLLLLKLCVVNADLLLLCGLTAATLLLADYKFFFCNPTTSPETTNGLCVYDLTQGVVLFSPVISLKQIIFRE